MAAPDPPFPHTWWKSATIYEIYPRSFFDSNGDGIGDLNGIYAKLDYLKDLGVDVLWLCPVYCSPQKDTGYDVSDYYNIDPVYGTMDDWRKLVRGIHDRGMKILMDYVSNHTSDEHPWFKESRSSKNNPKRDWYVWRPPKYKNGIRLPPNNWASVPGGSAWEFDQETAEYYLHVFTRHQPDLNRENPDVRRAMEDVVQFWIEQGCDGFRMDAICFISKTEGLPDAKVTDHTQYYQCATEHIVNRPLVHDHLRELYTNALEGHDVMAVGELGFTFEPPLVANYILPQNKQLNEAFNFELMMMGSMPGWSRFIIEPEWYPPEIKRIVRRWQTYGRDIGFWNTVFIENHDFGRFITRFGNDSLEWRAIYAKMLAVLQVTQTGTVYMYQGQEIGMKNFPRTWGIEEYTDVDTQLLWNSIKEKRQRETGEEEPHMEDILDGFQKTARDHPRIPMQWSADKNVGFTTGTPWRRAYEDDACEGWNVDDESKDSESVFSFWKRALCTRKEHDVLIYGSFEPRLDPDSQVFAYVRNLGNITAWVVLNLLSDPTEVSVLEDGLGLLETRPGFDLRPDLIPGLLPQLVLSNYDYAVPGHHGLIGSNMVLQGYEARVYVR